MRWKEKAYEEGTTWNVDNDLYQKTTRLTDHSTECRLFHGQLVCLEL
jgi:hypothetical protein